MCECWVDLALIQSCLWVLAKMGNDHQLPLYLLYIGLKLRAANLHPPCSLLLNLKFQSLWLVDFPSLVFARGTVKGVWDHFRLLDVPFCSCASETTWPSSAHCFHIDASIHLHKRSPEGTGRVRFWNACICRKKIQPDFILWFSVLKLPVVLLTVFKLF